MDVPKTRSPDARLAPASAGRGRWRLALGLSLALSALYGLPDMRTAFSGPYVVQDDARQHAFWTRRFQDPGLFPDDPIADYFQRVAPIGYELPYRAAAALGLDPVAFGKALPVPLALASAACTFGLAAQVRASPVAACLAAVLLSQQIWLTDELPATSPHSFAVPLLAAFLFYLARGSRRASLAGLALQGLVYPHALLVSCGTLLLTLVRLEGGRPRISRRRSDWVFCAAGLAVAALAVLPFALATSAYGPTVTAEAARRMPEFSEIGRAPFFDRGRDALDFWVNDMRSGILAKFFRAAGPYVHAGRPMLWGGLLLPVLVLAARRVPSAGRVFPLASQVTPSGGLLLRMALGSLILFAAAHAFLFELHLPSRYTRFSARVVLAVAGAATWTIVGDALLRRFPRRGLARRAVLLAGAVGVMAFLATPLRQSPGGSYVVGQAPALYRFLEAQPRDVLVASISPEADNIPTFARRSVLGGGFFAVPYQLGYYLPFRRRVQDLLRASYAEDPRVLREFVKAYDVDYFVVDRWSFRPRSLLIDSWVRQYRPLVEELAAELERGAKPALERLAAGCTVLETERLFVVDARCLLEEGATAPKAPASRRHRQVRSEPGWVGAQGSERDGRALTARPARRDEASGGRPDHPAAQHLISAVDDGRLAEGDGGDGLQQLDGR